MTAGSALATVLVLGGARSGKSAFAESLLEASDRRRIYVATAQIRDSEMENRIDRHRNRRGPDWTTLEEPLDLVETLARETGQGRALLIDCLTLWVTNLMLSDRDVDGECERLVAFVNERADSSGDAFVFVSNEVGLGIVPDNAMARAFRDHAGLLHAKLAAVVSEVYFVTAGLPLKIKG